MTADFAQTQISNLERERAALVEQITANQARLPIFDAQITALKALVNVDPKPATPVETKAK